jgi:hypothetical protein
LLCPLRAFVFRSAARFEEQRQTNPANRAHYALCCAPKRNLFQTERTQWCGARPRFCFARDASRIVGSGGRVSGMCAASGNVGAAGVRRREAETAIYYNSSNARSGRRESFLRTFITKLVRPLRAFLVLRNAPRMRHSPLRQIKCRTRAAVAEKGKVPLRSEGCAATLRSKGCAAKVRSIRRLRSNGSKRGCAAKVPLRFRRKGASAERRFRRKAGQQIKRRSSKAASNERALGPKERS